MRVRVLESFRGGSDLRLLAHDPLFSFCPIFIVVCSRICYLLALTFDKCYFPLRQCINVCPLSFIFQDGISSRSLYASLTRRFG